MNSRFRLAAALVGCAALAYGAETCDSAAAKKNQAYSKTGPHSWLASVQHEQVIETERTWCHIFETKGFDRINKGIDFGRVLFTGDGVHPAVGGIVPGSGFAGGLEYNMEHASASQAVRYSGSVEARGSYNGFWTAGGKLDILGSANKPDNRHIHATLDAEHYTLPKMAYYGQGNLSSAANQTFFSLLQTTAGGHLDVPLAGGFTLTGGLAGLWNSVPSNPATTYVVWGGSLQWIYPVAPRLNGLSVTATGGYKWYHETTGLPYSFARLDAIFVSHYRPPAKVDLGTISVGARFVDVDAGGGNQMPFYLQPTLGGTDINNVDALRSYRDYRFRAPNLLVFQAEYTHTLWGPVAFLGFYDTGRVFEERADIGFSQFRHSLGTGLVVQMGASPVFKFYYAWGGSEGSHTTYTMNTNNFTFSAPSGVF
jgi:hypothetical protein